MLEIIGLLRENYKNKWEFSFEFIKNGSFLVFFDCLLIFYDRVLCGIVLINFIEVCFFVCKLVK